MGGKPSQIDMSIEYNIDVVLIARDEYHELDYRVMNLVFSIHNDLGRFHDEKIYQRELVYRCQDNGLDALSEVPVNVSFDTFYKAYYMDIVIERAVVYELKAVLQLHPRHRAQTLNYLMLSGMTCGKLLNMRPKSVEHEYVTTSLTARDRYDYTVDTDYWHDVDDDALWLKDMIQRLIADWGVFLDCQLYRDAICHFRGGVDAVLKPVEIVHRVRKLGHEKLHLLNKDTAFHITAAKHGVAQHEKNIRKLLACTPLKAIHWINFHGHNVSLRTITTQ